MNPTSRQREYLDYIRSYQALHRCSPSEAEMVAFFRVTPPTVHQMVVTLTEKGFITREPGKARSIVVVAPKPVVAKPVLYIGDEEIPTRPPDDIHAPLDPDIAPLVHALRKDRRVLTKGSCWGHKKRPAYVDLAVEGVEGLRAFVQRINVVDRTIESEGFIDVTLNWSEEVATACAFDVFPNWIMLSLKIEGTGRGGSPSAELPERIAASYTRASKRGARRS